ncbi:peptidoglycan DD-metalloendopeptidase family protein [Methylobacterium brachiatum]|uniref:peptidoglycan DD-metalloendopeptidase family protein n=1 Tax=Methylobacterium brachiatum TaxID=269660 RepID=UPI0024490926|nr:peptidoglycan DD-metalloendopeptidase family protein [Methylobacterium brachiatum]MDH2311815.1 peptidoglycan DD-metalloendopeptidase family protein [Methylobacterium brachiatum]
MRVRGTGRGLRTLSRVALIGIIGGGAAACSSDASRLSNPFSNPFSSEPAATGSLPEGGLKPAPAIRTGRIQSEALGAPGAAPRPAATAIPAPTPAAAPATRVASTGTPGWSAQGGTQITVSKNDSLNQMSTRFGVPASAILSANGLSNASQITPGRQIVIPVYNASGLNPAAAPMTARPARAAEEKREDARQVEAKVASKREEAKEAAKREEAKREEAKETAKRAAAEKEADRKEALARDTAARKAAEEKSRKEASVKEADKKQHVRPGQVAKADEKKADPKADAKAQEAKAEAKAAAKAEAAQKLAEAKAAKEAAQKAAAAEKPEKVAVKETPKPVAAAAPAKPEPAATGSVADATPSESFRWPAKGRVISGYGTSGNEGINIAVPEGTPVKAAEEGTVAYAGSDVKGYGKLVLVRHANGFVSAYAHNGEIDVKPGDKVKRGQTIAKSGASGNVTSPQLHFEIRKGGSPVDPMSQLASN